MSADEGTVLNGAWNIYNGKKLYQDFFSFVAPGSFYYTFLSFKFFGPNYFAAKIFSLLLMLFSSFALYKISMFTFGKKVPALFSTWIWFFIASIYYPTINYNSHSSYLIIIAIWLYLIAITSKKLTTFITSGFILGAIICTSQHKGLLIAFIILVISIYFWVKKKIALRNLFGLFFGVLLVPVLTLIYWKPELLFENLIIWPTKYYLQYNPISLIAFISILSLFVLLFFLIRKFIKNKEILIILTLAQVFTLLSVSFQRDHAHILINSFFVVILVTVIPYILIKNKSILDILQNLGLSLSISLLLTIFFLIKIPELKIYHNYKGYFDTNGINQFYFYPYAPGLYFERGIQNDYPYDFLLAQLHPKEAFDENLEILKRKPPNIILSYELAYHLTGTNKYNYDLDSYIMNNYQEYSKLGPLIIMTKKPK